MKKSTRIYEDKPPRLEVLKAVFGKPQKARKAASGMKAVITGFAPGKRKR